MAKDLHITVLLDFYGEMLTDKQREIVSSYYNDDLSLSEIAEGREITRQGVRDTIKRSEQQLLDMEERLGLAKRFRKVQENLTLICDCALKIKALDNGKNEEISENIVEIISAAGELVEE
ncbi:MAG: YlxM family DNA-binding protein [Oscillospiraceae bacterium]